jgi:hypothetical protein
MEQNIGNWFESFFPKIDFEILYPCHLSFICSDFDVLL